MAVNIAIVQGHPDSAPERFGRVLQAAYAEGARAAGHEVRVIDVASLDFPLLRSKRDWEAGEPCSAVTGAQDTLFWAHHLVLFYPLWAGSMPALLKGFLEQALRPGFAMEADPRGIPRRLLAGRSARIVITMGMPALAYRWFFGAHSLKALERNVLGLCGIAPIQSSLVGRIDDPDPAARRKWIARMRALGAADAVSF